MYPSPFYQFQTLSDLTNLARSSPPSERARLLSYVPSSATLDDINALIDGPVTALRDLSPGLTDNLLFAALQPQENRASFSLATVLLVRELITQPDTRDDLWHHWDTQQAAYANLPRATHSAILRGYAVAHALGKVTLPTPPADDDRLTTPKHTVLMALRDCARTLDDAQIESIARADYGMDAARNAAALRALLASSRLLLPLEGRHIPGEVLELVSLVPGRAGFAQCSALILIEALERGDPFGTAAFRWRGVAAAYRALPSAEADPLLRGFRALAETDPTWDPYFEMSDTDRAAQTVPIPLAAP